MKNHMNSDGIHSLRVSQSNIKMLGQQLAWQSRCWLRCPSPIKEYSDLSTNPNT